MKILIVDDEALIRTVIKEYCENNNIPLIYIKYTEYEKLNINSIYFPELIHWLFDKIKV